MKPNNLVAIGFDLEQRQATSPVSILLLVIGVPLGICSFGSVLVGGSPLVALDMAMAWFVMLAIAYLGLHGFAGLQWCSVPVLLTLRALLEYSAIPAWRFASGHDPVDHYYVHAMILALVGFTSLWIGSVLFMRSWTLRFAARSQETSARVAIAGVALCLVGLAGKLTMWKLGLLSYMADSAARASSLPYLYWLGNLANLLEAALVVSAIEIFGKRSTEPVLRVVFWLSLTCVVVFGALSGMKQNILQPLLLLVLIYAITRGRFPRVSLLLPLLFVLIYPVMNAYRDNLDSGYRSQVNTLGGLNAVVLKTIGDIPASFDNPSSASSSAEDRDTARLSCLTDLSQIISVPTPSFLNGEEKMWLAPIYSFIPRFIWKNKPVMNKGARLTVALGGRETSSSAVTPIGDLYVTYGISGVAVGMFIYGIGLQLYMNWIASRVISERTLFIYLAMLMTLINLESDVAGLIAGVVDFGILALFLSYVIYGPREAQCTLLKAGVHR